jgi:hypothetical protein
MSDFLPALAIIVPDKRQSLEAQIGLKMKAQGKRRPFLFIKQPSAKQNINLPKSLG